MFVFPKTWRALFSSNTCYEIRSLSYYRRTVLPLSRLSDQQTNVTQLNSLTYKTEVT